jgi:hypothetical protein
VQHMLGASEVRQGGWKGIRTDPPLIRPAFLRASPPLPPSLPFVSNLPSMTAPKLRSARSSGLFGSCGPAVLGG